MKNIYIMGAGVQAGVAIEALRAFYGGQYRVAVLYDDARRGTAHHLRILGKVEKALQDLAPEDGVHIAFGTYASSKALGLIAEFQRKGMEVINIVSPRANIATSAKIGVNARILSGTYIGHEVRIGRSFTAHGNCAVEHNTRIGDNVLLGPGAALAGYVVLGSHCFVGAGVSIAPGVKIGHGVLLGTGAVVVKDIPDGVVAYGCPARPMRDTRTGDEVPPLKELRKLGLKGR